MSRGLFVFVSWHFVLAVRSAESDEWVRDLAQRLGGKPPARPSWVHNHVSYCFDDAAKAQEFGSLVRQHATIQLAYSGMMPAYAAAQDSH